MQWQSTTATWDADLCAFFCYLLLCVYALFVHLCQCVRLSMLVCWCFFLCVFVYVFLLFLFIFRLIVLLCLTWLLLTSSALQIIAGSRSFCHDCSLCWDEQVLVIPAVFFMWHEHALWWCIEATRIWSTSIPSVYRRHTCLSLGVTLREQIMCMYAFVSIQRPEYMLYMSMYEVSDYACKPVAVST
jgi:hypothetical protein